MPDKKKQITKNELTPFQKNMLKSAKAIRKLEKAGYTIMGGPTGRTVLKGKSRTLKNGCKVQEYEAVWRGDSYVDAVKILLRSSKKNATTKKVAVKKLSRTKKCTAGGKKIAKGIKKAKK